MTSFNFRASICSEVIVSDTPLEFRNLTSTSVAILNSEAIDFELLFRVLFRERRRPDYARCRTLNTRA